MASNIVVSMKSKVMLTASVILFNSAKRKKNEKPEQNDKIVKLVCLIRGVSPSNIRKVLEFDPDRV